MSEFQEFGKIARLKRGCVITEKIDGTNAQIHIADDLAPFTLQSGRGVVPFMVGSRNRWIFPENDNFGFAKWAYENADELLKLGPGRHFGEWWGAGIQRRYGLGATNERRFSLFNSGRWTGDNPPPACCLVVPILYAGPFDTAAIDGVLEGLRRSGSVAAPGFMDPEGIVIYHEASRQLFKVTLDDDAVPKSLAAKAKAQAVSA